jgi:hypothetical protein
LTGSGAFSGCGAVAGGAGRRLGVRGSLGRSFFGGLGGGLGRGLGGGLGGLARQSLLLLALPALFGQLFFLQADLLGLGACLFLAALQVEFVDAGASGLFDRGRRVVALDEDTLLAHLDLDRARLAAGIGLLDLAGALARQRDLLALAGRRRAMRGAKKLEQTFLVGLGQGVVGRALAQAGRLQLLEQRRRGAIELRGELGDGGHGHVQCFLSWCVRAVRVVMQCGRGVRR